jgi:alanine racemase
METTSWIEISESALQKNIAFIHRLLGDKVTFSSVVKGNAYGHGIGIFCPLAYKLGVRHFSTFDAFEAEKVMHSIGKTDFTLMIMGWVSDDQMEWVIENEIEFFIFNWHRMNKALEKARKVGKKARIHLEFETGMNRTGFDIRDIRSLHKILLDNTELIELRGVCSHLAGAESIANYKRLQDQSKRFKKIHDSIHRWSGFDPQFHLSCSAGTLRYPKYKFDMTRIGILQYGFFPSPEVHVQYVTKNKTEINPLQRIISWKTRVMEIKEVKVGEFVGYGTSYFSNTPKKIATIPVGYSAGYARSLSNNGIVIIRGARFNVIGMVNMNMMAVDITTLENAEIGDEVVLIGKQGDAEITVASFSEFSHLVNYELLTRLPKEINRIITK